MYRPGPGLETPSLSQIHSRSGRNKEAGYCTEAKAVIKILSGYINRMPPGTGSFGPITHDKNRW